MPRLSCAAIFFIAAFLYFPIEEGEQLLHIWRLREEMGNVGFGLLWLDGSRADSEGVRARNLDMELGRDEIEAEKAEGRRM